MLFFQVIVIFAIQFDSLNEFKHPYWPQNSQKKTFLTKQGNRPTTKTNSRESTILSILSYQNYGTLLTLDLF